MQLDKKGCKKKVEQIVVIRCQSQLDQHGDQSHLRGNYLLLHPFLSDPLPSLNPQQLPSLTSLSSTLQFASLQLLHCVSEFIAIPSVPEISQVCFSSLSQLHFSVIFVFLPILFGGFLFPFISNMTRWLTIQSQVLTTDFLLFQDLVSSSFLVSYTDKII